MAASRMCQGVAKSGSPTPSEMTSAWLWTRSKNSRMPERGIPATWPATNCWAWNGGAMCFVKRSLETSAGKIATGKTQLPRLASGLAPPGRKRNSFLPRRDVRTRTAPRKRAVQCPSLPGERLPRLLDAPALPEELEHVALVRLVPRNLHRGDGADVEALDLGEAHQFIDEVLVLRDRAHRE